MEISVHEPPACGTWQYWCLAAEGDVGVCTEKEVLLEGCTLWWLCFWVVLLGALLNTVLLSNIGWFLLFVVLPLGSLASLLQRK